MKQFLIQGGEKQAWGAEQKANKLHEEERALEMKNRILAGVIRSTTLPL